MNSARYTRLWRRDKKRVVISAGEAIPPEVLNTQRSYVVGAAHPSLKGIIRRAGDLQLSIGQVVANYRAGTPHQRRQIAFLERTGRLAYLMTRADHIPHRLPK